MSESLNSDQQQQLLFMMLLQQHEQIAMMGMGKIKSPVTDKIERDMKSAKYAIDTLVMLEKFTSGNLSKELSGYLTQMLTNLRMNFADEKKKESAGAPKVGESAKSEGSPKDDGSPEKEDSSTSGNSSKKDESSNGGGTKTEGASKNVESAKKEKSPKTGDTSQKEDK